MKEDFLIKKLAERKEQNAFRQLRLPAGKIDFCSNDYLGIVSNRLIEGWIQDHTPGLASFSTGSTGSRLLAGNYPLMEQVESEIASFHKAPAALLFNSGFDANTGLLSCVAQRGDTVIYDYLSHASIRDGIRLSQANAFAFKHNDLDDLHQKLQRASGNLFVVTESVFSMDGDKAPLAAISELCKAYDAHLVVDEAHATGVVGLAGEGLVQHLGLEAECFARIHTFGKACGAHGAVVLGSHELKDYLINFSRSFIYTTALPEISVAAIQASYDIFPRLVQERMLLNQHINRFQQASSQYEILRADSPIQIVMIAGNDQVKQVAHRLQDMDLDVRAILHPSVPKGQERLRIVLHAFNTDEEVARLIATLE